MVRTIALAVDGMEPSLLNEWIGQGELPNIRSVRKMGSYGTATCSSLSSARQWTSHFTGVSEEYHGVSGFTKDQIPEDYGGKTRAPDVQTLINTSDIQVKTYPELLSEGGVTCGLLNPLPLWPPLELEDGFCVSGQMTPPDTKQWTYPPELADQLSEFGYRIDVKYDDRPYGFVDDALFASSDVSLSQLWEDMFEVLQTRTKCAKFLLKQHETEFLYVLLKSIDIIQHAFWIHMIEDDDEFGDCILESYRTVDKFVGWVQSEYPDANVLIFSDHGFETRRDSPPDLVHTVAKKFNEYVPVPFRLKRLYSSVASSDADLNPAQPEQVSGDHSTPATWMAVGPNIENTSAHQIAFEDLPPTLLAVHDHPIPADYVGEPIDSLSGITPRTIELDLSVQRDKKPSQSVSERLYNLGYAEMVDE